MEGLPGQVGDLAGGGVGADDVCEGRLVGEQRDGRGGEVGGVDGGEVARAADGEGVEVHVDERHGGGLEPEGDLLEGGDVAAGEADAFEELGEAVPGTLGGRRRSRSGSGSSSIVGRGGGRGRGMGSFLFMLPVTGQVQLLRIHPVRSTLPKALQAVSVCGNAMTFEWDVRPLVALVSGGR